VTGSLRCPRGTVRRRSSRQGRNRH
jgi:hypothetical protein